VLAYHLPVSTPEGRRLVGQLALLDVTRGTGGRAYTVCADPDVVVDAVLEPGPPGPVAYVAVWRPPALLDGRWRPAGGRVLAVDAQTGDRLGAAALPGTPAQLRLAQAPGDTGRLLYCLVGGLGPEGDPGAETDLFANGPRRLLGFDPATLRPEREYALPHPVRALAVTPDGAAAYALDAAGRREVIRVDLHTGAARHLAALPGAGADLAVTRERVFVADGRAAVWALDARSGALARTLAVGRGPVGLALSEPM
jgi:hypothetical protein